MAQGSTAADPRRRPVVSAVEVDPSVPDCTACGVCCFSDRSDYLPVFEVDYERMNGAARRLVRSATEGRFMAMKDGRCSALRIENDPRRSTCAIYPRRPDCCRWLVRGSALCRSYVAERLSE